MIPLGQVCCDSPKKQVKPEKPITTLKSSSLVQFVDVDSDSSKVLENNLKHFKGVYSPIFVVKNEEPTCASYADKKYFCVPPIDCKHPRNEEGHKESFAVCKSDSEMCCKEKVDTFQPQCGRTHPKNGVTSTTSKNQKVRWVLFSRPCCLI